jgi:hypothetical protein
MKGMKPMLGEICETPSSIAMCDYCTNFINAMLDDKFLFFMSKI